MMKAYVKPMILANDELAEGVYAASGDCWTVTRVTSTQEWDGSNHVFEIGCSHSQEAVHISTVQRFKLVFSQTITNAYSNDNGVTVTSFEGNTVYIERNGHGNAYESGETASFKVRVKAADEATTKAISCTSASCTYCDHQTNVQGGVD